MPRLPIHQGDRQISCTLGCTRTAASLALLALVLLGATALQAQSLNPRAYWPAPEGTSVISFGYAYTSGGFLTDPSLPIEDVDSQTHGFQLGYVRFFNLGGRTARFAFTIPRAESTVNGLVQGEERSRVLSGYADSSVEFSINLKGAPVMSREEFVGYLRDPRPIVGLSVTIQAPSGAYDPERLVNLGSNRWSAQSELGYIGVSRGWVTELTAGIRFFSTNEEFLGLVREQEPIVSASIHLGRPVRRTNPNFWFSIGVGCQYGGRTTVDGEEKNDVLQNWRYGGTLTYPVGKGRALRLQISESLSTSVGEDSTAAILAFSKAW